MLVQLASHVRTSTFQCSALAAWAACSLDLGVRAWAGGQFGGYQAWRLTEHMTTTCALCSISAPGGFKRSHFFRLWPCPVSGVPFSPVMAPWCWFNLLPMCELAPFQCSDLAACAACSLDLGVRAWAGGHFGGYQAWRFTEHMTTIYAPCVVFLHFLCLACWAVAGWAGWLAGWCRRQQKTSF